MKPYYQSDSGDIVLYHGDCRAVMAALADGSVSAVVTDPPYALTSQSRNGSPRQNSPETPHGRTRPGGDRGFMGKTWDNGRVAFDPDTWVDALNVLRPGGHLLAFGGTRTYHRLACAIEDAGFEIRDQIQWLYGSGFPKSLDVSKAIDAARRAEREVVGIDESRAARLVNQTGEYVTDAGWSAGNRSAEITAPATDAAKQWNGWGTALKPAHEPIVVARKPLCGTVAANVQQYGTGALNIDGCRVPVDGDRPLRLSDRHDGNGVYRDGLQGSYAAGETSQGRWPANIIHDGSDEVLAEFAKAGETVSRASPANNKPCGKKGAVLELSHWDNWHTSGAHHGDAGTPARFFYCAKASRRERGDGNNHPTVKPLALLTYLCRLVTPPAGTILDPFAGSGTTLLAARLEGMKAIGIEQSEEYCEIIVRRLEGRHGAKAEQTAGTSRELSLFD